METITMVKYTAEQIDHVLAMLASVTGDSKAYECSLPMMSVVLDINNYLREHAIICEEAQQWEVLNESDATEENGVVLSSGDANV